MHLDLELPTPIKEPPIVKEQEQKERIVRIGPPSTDDDMAAKEGEKIARHAYQTVATILKEQGFMPLLSQKVPEVVVCVYITKQHFAYLGRPTVDDFIELNARTDRGH